MKQQDGYTLLELILVVGLLASMTILGFQEKSLEVNYPPLNASRCSGGLGKIHSEKQSQGFSLLKQVT